VAMIIATCDTPHRFRTKRQFWTYCGFAVVTRSSSDYFENGELRKRRQPALTGGLNRNYNRRLKWVFKNAATSGSRRGPFKLFYEQRTKTRFSQTHLGPGDLSDRPGHVEERRTIRS
jgi:transposase